MTSSSDEIHILAKDSIVLKAGQSSITIKGGDVTFACPGQFSVKGNWNAFIGPGSRPAALQGLPQRLADRPPNFIELNLHDSALRPKAGYPYVVTFNDGTRYTGNLDSNGHARIEGVPNCAAKIFYGDSPNPFTPDPVSVVQVTEKGLSADLRKLGLNPESTDLEALIRSETGRSK